MIKPEGYPEPFEVYCDNTDSSGGWTVIQRRADGSIDFRARLGRYKSGFGFLSHEFWLGNEKLSFLTNQKKYQLVIEITTSSGYLIRVSYDHFRISDAFSHFKLGNLSNYSGENTDAITFCPSNMDIDNCSTACQRTCEAPGICQDEVCTDGEVCFCPDGFFMKGSDCVPREQCGCYVSEGKTIVPEGEFFVNSGCTRKGVCTNGLIIWDEGYACSPKAECGVRNDIRQCYCANGYRGDGVTCTRPPKDCQEIYDDDSARNSGIYRIKPTGWTGSAFEVYCNMTDGGGWTRYRIRIDLVTREYNSYYGKFDFFRINDESDNYRLSGLGTYSGTVDERSSPDGKFLRYHLNHEFSTKERDNDAYSNNCAVSYHGAWWYDDCYDSNLNGDYHASLNSYSSIYCYYIPGPDYNIKYTEMKIRPA
ncbi:putative ficolin-2-like [Apostichopus japonicus]|uniref:Putative ficolin-2-like n=1 Tax=Stichopus japonicus TaxID=307972 RepID=A0A2G8JMH2_STIJA|nr:putative ficolin-2-like [Apostichopus japonicus]